MARVTKIPFLDLAAAVGELRDELDTAVARVLSSGQYIGGGEVDAFETEFARYTESAACVGVGNGLDALRLALWACGVGPGDEVIVPSHTFIATWLAVTACGATPVPAEPDETTFTLDPARVEAALTPRTKAIVPVHLYGHPADLDPLLALARRRGLRVIEDAAQAHGARYKGRRIGAHGDAVAWSFYPAKNLGALGDGGAITTDSLALADRLRSLRNYGSTVKYVHEEVGCNSRLDAIQAAILRVKLRHLDAWNARRARLARAYDTALRGTDLHTPAVASWAEPVWHLYVVRSADREDLQRRLEAAGVASQVHYPVPPHRQRAYATSTAAEQALPIADRLAASVLSLPIGPHVPDAVVPVVVSARPREVRSVAGA